MPKKTRNKAPKATTTITTSVEARDRLMKLARLRGMSLGTYLDTLSIEAERCEKRGDTLRKKLQPADLNFEETFVKMANMISAMHGRKTDKDVFISFFRKMEQDKIKPMQVCVEEIKAKLESLISAINSLKVNKE